jgi:hypothetical protein
MKSITTGLGLAIALGLAGLSSTAMGQDWNEDFESYSDGQLLDNVNGWRGWDNSSGVVGNCSTEQAHGGTKSIRTDANDDAIHNFAYNTGAGTVTAWVYLSEATFADDHYFILNNEYVDLGPYKWFTQLHFDKTGGVDGDNTVYDDLRTETGTAPAIAFDQWVEIRVELDIAADTCTTYYNNIEVSTGVLFVEQGLHEVQNMDLYSVGATCYYDDLSITGLTNVLPCPSDFAANQVGSCPGANRVSWSGAPANSAVRVVYTSNGGGGGVIPPNSPCPGTTLCIGLAGVTLHPQVLHSSGSGTGLTPTFSAPCGLHMQLITQASCKTSNAITL